MTPAAYDLADRLYKLAPWKWMGEIKLIAIEEPETRRIDHISMMGMNGEHHSMAVYLGAEARHRFNLMQDDDDLSREDMLHLILDTPQLQCSFSDRSDLFKSELAAIKAAGKKYRGENWPTFRTFRPGHCPVPANESETRWLCTAIEQVLEIAPTVDFGDDTLRYENGRCEILTRRFLNGEWRTDWTPDDNAIYAYPEPAATPVLVEKVRNHARAVAVEVAFMMMPNPIGKSRETSVFPYILLVVEPTSRFVLGMELQSIESRPHEAIASHVPELFLRICDKQGIRPASIDVASACTAALLKQTATALGIPCKQRRRLAAMDDVLQSMMRFS